MSDSTDGGQGGGAADMVPAARLNKMMADYQRVLAENRTLKEGGGLAPDGQGNPSTGAEQQTHWEPGTMLEVGDDGSLSPWSPPTPLMHNESRSGVKPDDGSARYLREKLARESAGAKPIRTTWQD